MEDRDYVWIFHGVKAQFSSGVFSSREKAENWIKTHKLTGILSQYPLNQGVYDWAIENNYFKPKNTELVNAEFIQRFSSASQIHFHYLEGALE
jgi:hypothetical protein